MPRGRIVNNVAPKPSLGPRQSKRIPHCRLTTQRDKNSAVILRFVDQSTRAQWLAKRKLLSTLELGVFTTENMATRNRTLLSETREWALGDDYRFAWHRNARVFVSKEEGHGALIIKCERNLGNLKVDVRWFIVYGIHLVRGMGILAAIFLHFVGLQYGYTLCFHLNFQTTNNKDELGVFFSSLNFRFDFILS